VALVAALATLVALAGAAPAAHARTVRVFAMQPKLDLAWMESRDTYRAKMLALVDARSRGPGTPAIQRGAGDAASHLLGPADPAHPVATARDLIVWPEDLGLFAGLTGPRAASARGSGSFELAIVSLIGAYGPQNAYYAQRFPDAANRSLPVRLTEISLTDTFAHTAVETFAGIADRTDAYVEVGVNMAQSWQIVCDDLQAFNRAQPPRLPGGVLCQEQSAQKVAALREPTELTRDYAYEATSDRVSNMALVFDPDGRLISKQVKTYLTPVELPGQLDLVPGEVTGGLSAVRTPVGTLGFVTSKDAWMPDVQAKLDEAHVDLLVQPEFFVNDLVRAEGMFAPDTLLASGYGDVLRMPSVKAMVLPELTGNIFDFSADAQSHFAVKPGRSGGGGGGGSGSGGLPSVGGGGLPSGHLVGQPDAPGLDASPWVVPDPVKPGESFAERRRRLGEAGRALSPGSGVACADPGTAAPCENGHVEGVFRRDVRVGEKPRFKRFRGRVRPTRLSRARALTRSRAPQRGAAVAMRGRRVAAAWEERRGGHDRVLVATSRDGGRRWSRAARPSGRRGSAANERWPAVAVGARGRVTVAWSDDAGGVAHVLFSRSAPGGRGFSAPRPVDGSAPELASQLKPALAQGRGDLVHAAWIDDRERSADDDLPQAHLLYARIARGRPGPPRRLDADPPVALAAKLDHAWAPRIATRGRRVLVTWLDFQNYDWGVFSRLSTDDGGGFGKQARVTDNDESADAQQEELADSPDAAFTGRRGTPLIAWTDWRKRDTAAAPHQEYDVFVASPGAANRQVDPYGARQVSTFAPSICATGKERAIVAYQDSSRGRSEVRAVTVGGSGGGGSGDAGRGRARLLSDAGARGGNAWRPRIACSGGRVVALWEDERDGPPRLYVSHGSARRLR
jgi:uncharacterized membrane protein YgcG